MVNCILKQFLINSTFARMKLESAYQIRITGLAMNQQTRQAAHGKLPFNSIRIDLQNSEAHFVYDGMHLATISLSGKVIDLSDTITLTNIEGFVPIELS